MASDGDSDIREIARRVSDLESDNRRQWREINRMQTDVKERLAALETSVNAFSARLDRAGYNGPASSRDNRFERLWGVLQFGAWAVFIAILTAGFVVSLLEYVQ